MRIVASIILGCLFVESIFAAEFKFLTDNGWVQFEVVDEWPVNVMQTKPPIARMVFQIPNSADEGLLYSTNISLSFISTNSSEAGQLIESFGVTLGEEEPNQDEYNGWTIMTQLANENGAIYTIVDALKPMSDLTVMVRIAWPNLANNTPNYSITMYSTYLSVLDSIEVNVGEYETKPGERWLRKES